MSQTNIKCPICISDLDKENDVVVHLPCHHDLCNHCYEQLQQSSCPLCRRSFSMRRNLPKYVIEHFKPQIVDIVNEVVAANNQVSAGIEELFNEYIVVEPNRRNNRNRSPALPPPGRRRRRGGRSHNWYDSPHDPLEHLVFHLS